MDGLGNNQQFTIDDLRKNRLDREKTRQIIYRTIYAKCLSQIKYTNDKIGVSFCEYKVPSFIYGMPRYDLEQCIYHLVYWLRHEGYDVTYRSPDLLFIRWDPPQDMKIRERVKFRPVEIVTDNPVGKYSDKTDDDNLGLLLRPKGILKDSRKSKKK